jgi:hypothetical protein
MKANGRFGTICRFPFQGRRSHARNRHESSNKQRLTFKGLHVIIFQKTYLLNIYKGMEEHFVKWQLGKVWRTWADDIQIDHWEIRHGDVTWLWLMLTDNGWWCQTFGFYKNSQFLDKLNKYQLLKKSSVLWVSLFHRSLCEVKVILSLCLIN